MTAEGRNKGFHVQDEFVCEAIHTPTVPLANPANQGRNAGMTLLEELVFDPTFGPDIADEQDSGYVE